MIACVPKKPLRLSEMNNSVTVRSNGVGEFDIELDSLDGNGSDNTLVVGEDTEHLNNTENKVNNKANGNGTIAVKHLNLNNIIKNQQGELNQCYVEEIVLPGESLQSLSDLQVLSLRANGIQNFPATILQLTSLVTLDMACNCMLTIPPEINQLISLKELILDHNLISILPDTIWDLKFLSVLKTAFNKLTLLPDKNLLEMKSPITMDSNNMGHERKHSHGKSTKSYAKNPNGLTNLNLRGNKLKGHIILGNYNCLTELDVSENGIEILDLGAVEQLQVLQCSRNQITQLTLYGKNLVSVIAGNNKLKSFTTTLPPIHLKHFDVSYNDLERLPDWLAGCSELRSLFASNNLITSLPEHIFCNEMPFLQTVQLAYNQLQYLPLMQRKLPIQELFLQNNSLSSLPDNFFKCVRNIKVLNLSNNRLVDLPTPDEVLQLEKLYLTANCLLDKSLEKTSPYLRNIKIIHVAYNNLTAIPDNGPMFWSELEELVLSGNRIGNLPENIRDLKHLAVLRVHSNVLQSIPALSSLPKLRVLDLAHNHLDRIDLKLLIPPNLKFLDLSCNTKLHVDSQQFNTYRTQRPISLVDVSGKNRTTLPLAPGMEANNEGNENCWTVGFSETPGSKQKLHIVQVRLPTFCNAEALLGLFDGENNGDAPVGVDKLLPRILLEERTVKETAHDYIKFTMLSTYRHLKTKGVKHGLNAVIIHIFKLKPANDFSRFSESLQKHMMKISCIGDAQVVLGKSNGTVDVLPFKSQQTRTTPPMQLTIPDPDVTERFLADDDEYLIVANKNLWNVMTPENAIKEVHQQKNVILAAKRLQDLAQSYGAEENLSIIVVKLNLSKVQNNVDLLMKELRQTIRQNKFQNHENNIPSSVICQPGCCCGPPNNDCINCVDSVTPVPPPMMLGDDRSSPSGQSDHACSDCNTYTASKIFIGQLTRQSDSRLFRSVTPSIFESSVDVKSNTERRSYRGVAKALRQKREEERTREDSDSAMSEEQFKCWEYMLEQNTQKLFDKELSTLHGRERFSTPLSVSSPHLNSDGNNNYPGGVFLSRQFGSSRSFNPTLSKSTSRLTLEKNLQNKTQLLGGPNAAYFGSLQRLMPYNLEYDFSVMHERGLVDSLDLDRMQQYWGVATTEL